MDPEDALEAANLLKPRLVVPMHYTTFPVIRQDADLFVVTLMRRGIKGMKMAPGDAIELQARGPRRPLRPGILPHMGQAGNREPSLYTRHTERRITCLWDRVLKPCPRKS